MPASGICNTTRTYHGGLVLTGLLVLNRPTLMPCTRPPAGLMMQKEAGAEYLQVSPKAAPPPTADVSASSCAGDITTCNSCASHRHSPVHAVLLQHEMSEARKAVTNLDAAVSSAHSFRERSTKLLEEAHRALGRLEQVRSGAGRGGEGCWKLVSVWSSSGPRLLGGCALGDGVPGAGGEEAGWAWVG